MRKFAQADQPAIYRKLREQGLKTKKYTGGYPYSQNGLLIRSSLSEPIYSYAKNYTKFKKEFSLFIWTTCPDEDKVYAHFDKVFKGLKRQQIMEVLNNIKSMSYVEPKLV